MAHSKCWLFMYESKSKGGQIFTAISSNTSRSDPEDEKKKAGPSAGQKIVDEAGSNRPSLSQKSREREVKCPKSLGQMRGQGIRGRSPTPEKKEKEGPKQGGTG